MDRIDDAYNGLMGDGFMRKTRERMHWICAKVEGGNVLDIGCSQGTLARLLSSAGKSVLGVDVNLDAIAYANAKLDEMDEAAKGRLRFQCGNFMDFKSDERFDTVVMGEVLEHLPIPDAFIQKAHACLKQGGIYVVTVPFGINDDPDHRQTFYWTWITEKFAPYFEVREVKIFGRWIGVVGVRRGDKRVVEQTVPLTTVKELEQAFYAQERVLVDDCKAKKIKLERQKEMLDETRQRLGMRIETLRRERDIARIDLSEKRARVAELERAVKARDSELSKTRGELSKTRADCDAERRKYEKLAQAKLGRLTLAYWRIKDSIKAKLRGGRTSTKDNPGNRIPTSSVVVPAQSPASPPKGDEGFFARMAPKIMGMPVSNGSRYYERIPVKIGIICDRFYWDAINSAADFEYVSPNVTEDVLAKLDCMLVVSTWRGLENDEWQGIAKDGHPMRLRANEIIDYCRKNKIPTLFYSKEDPPNYAVFVGVARKCDFIFTSAEECVPDYRRDCGHDRVFPMRFCVNPVMHNPIGMRHVGTKERNVIFSGSWMEKYPQRCRDLEMIFDGVIDSGRSLNIVDRNYERCGNPLYRYPEKYRQFQSPAIDHGDLQKVHKLFDWAVNINSVTDSMTMFANRAYELLASGNLMLSNYSVGISKTLPTIFLIQDRKEVPQILNAFTEEEVYERQMAGVRRVMTDETCFDRIAEMLDLAGIRNRNDNARKVLVIVDKITDRIRFMFDRQSLRNKSLVSVDNLTGEVYDGADIITFFNPTAHYGVSYLEDMANGFKYTDCDYITKDAFVYNDKIVPGVEHSYVNVMPDRARTIFWRNSFRMNQLLSLGENVNISNGYSIDHFSFKINGKKQG